MIMIMVLAAMVYVAIKIYRILPARKGVKIAVMAVYGLAAASFILSWGSLCDHFPMGLARAIYIFGNSWLIFLLYAFLAFLLFDVLILMRLLPRSQW